MVLEFIAPSDVARIRCGARAVANTNKGEEGLYESVLSPETKEVIILVVAVIVAPVRSLF